MVQMKHTHAHTQNPKLLLDIELKIWWVKKRKQIYSFDWYNIVLEMTAASLEYIFMIKEKKQFFVFLNKSLKIFFFFFHGVKYQNIDSLIAFRLILSSW